MGTNLCVKSASMMNFLRTHVKGPVLYMSSPLRQFHKNGEHSVAGPSSQVKESRKLKNADQSLKDFMPKLNSKGIAEISDDKPYNIEGADFSVQGKKVFLETYGCQMNVNDTEIAWSILEKNGYEKATTLESSDIALVVTCSIREGAEQKIWNRLTQLKALKLSRPANKPFQMGILGCMAERLKEKILEREKLVDVICGPDAYRDLPRLLKQAEPGRAAVNVQLSLEETYADVMPIRVNPESKNAFVSIMRGCDNMCTYCIVPFTRGRERSRPIDSIVEEVRHLSQNGYKEVTILGQNVNSYRDTSETTVGEATSLSSGFKTVYKPKIGGKRFSDLLDRVSEVDPDMRIRFTSPHPKDFPDEVIELIKERSNICNHLHMPAQSGSTRMLEAMKRGYTREAYLELVEHIRGIIPDVALTSDFIAGFCGETEADHKDTVSMINMVKYNWVYCFPYSMRQKTKAYHRLNDDVSEEDKKRRHMELHDAFRAGTNALNQAQVGQLQLVLIEGRSKRSENDLAGRNDGNTKVIIPKMELPHVDNLEGQRDPIPGDYVLVQITEAPGLVLKGTPLYRTSLVEHSREQDRLVTMNQ